MAELRPYFCSRDTSMETTTSSSLPPPFTPEDIREASISLSESVRQKPIPKARSIENLADVSSSKLSILNRAFTARSSWPDKEEFLDVVYWIRQVLGVVLGLIWGSFALHGVVGLALFAILNAGILYVYFSAFQVVDEEEFGGAWELTKEGFMTSFATFMVVWIILYTGLHFDN